MGDIYWAFRHRWHWRFNREAHRVDCLCKGSGRILMARRGF